ncbi:unnamed protein product [Urochloa humidicola]
MDPYEFPPGVVDFRPRRILAAAARSRELKEEERALERYTLVAVQRDSCVPLSCDVVLCAALQQLGIPEQELAVEGLSQAKFLLRFGSLQSRNMVLATPTFQAGSCVLNIMPWSRRIGAAVGRLRYRARVCLEGVPRHARNAAAVAQLFSNPSYIDEIDSVIEEEAERFTFNIWVWTDAPNDLALQGTLQIEEPLIFPEHCYSSMDSMELVFERDEPLKTFNYEVLIHLDRVLDYSPPSVNSRRSSSDSGNSGIPGFESPAVEYPEKFDFTWFLGVVDGERPPRRPSVQDRLGGRVEHPARSPPRGGNGRGLGLRQWPPASVHDVARMPFRRHDDGAGSSSNHGAHGGGRRRSAGDVCKVGPGDRMGKRSADPMVHCQKGAHDSSVKLAGMEERMHARKVQTGHNRSDEVQELMRMGADTEASTQAQEDPMRFEASLVQKDLVQQVGFDSATQRSAALSGGGSHGQDCSAQTKRSVEPTSANAGPSLPNHEAAATVVTEHAPQFHPNIDRESLQLDTSQEEVQQVNSGEGMLPSVISADSMIMKAEVPDALQDKALEMECLAVAEENCNNAAGNAEVLQDFETVAVIHENTAANVEEVMRPTSNAEQIPKEPESFAMEQTRELFDLNQIGGFHEFTEDATDVPELLTTNPQTTRQSKGPKRPILGVADVRLNKDTNQRPHSKGIARLSVPLKKALLCNPAVRSKPTHLKKHSDKGQKPTPSANIHLSVDEKATALLMRSTATIGENEIPTDEAKEKFAEQLVDPMESGFVTNMRSLFGLTVNGLGTGLEVLAIDADD